MAVNLDRWRSLLDRRRYETLTIIVCVFALAACGVLYSDWTRRSSERKFCDIISTSLSAYEQYPPTTDLGRKLKQNYIDLYERLGCR